ncbi:MAG: DUF1841 family protein [Acidiferrobacterales bacterium]|jgi:hypothetical protein|nr:DUF1841 family protein [Acidiferrobacterales bacterium]
MSLFASSRQDTREVFFRTWEKLNHEQPLEGIEILIAKVIQVHPEYHSVLANRDTSEDRDYLPESGETNPFLHMGMHVAIEEQLSVDQPRGIREQYEKLMLRFSDPHEVQHYIMECLGEMLWQAQRQQTAPDERIYLECLQKFNKK